jgi:hypothetical protein
MGIIKTSKRMQAAKHKGDPTPIGRHASAQRSTNSICRMVHCENDDHGMLRWF